MYTGEALMDLDRGTLARIDRKLFAAVRCDERFQMVRVPVTPAKWSTWRRYCEVAGVSMGRAIVALIDREIVSVFGKTIGADIPVFAPQVDDKLTAREAHVAGREEEVEAAKDRLRIWESELEVREQRIELASGVAARRKDAAPKVGRNERCPCGSGLKHKYCHGG